MLLGIREKGDGGAEQAVRKLSCFFVSQHVKATGFWLECHGWARGAGGVQLR